MSTGNLPAWPGASVVYSRCYRLLEHMGSQGHVRMGTSYSRRWGVRPCCYPSDEMNDWIDALNKGDEERLKYALLLARDLP